MRNFVPWFLRPRPLVVLASKSIATIPRMTASTNKVICGSPAQLVAQTRRHPRCARSHWALSSPPAPLPLRGWLANRAGYRPAPQVGSVAGPERELDNSSPTSLLGRSLAGRKMRYTAPTATGVTKKSATLGPNIGHRTKAAMTQPCSAMLSSSGTRTASMHYHIRLLHRTRKSRNLPSTCSSVL